MELFAAAGRRRRTVGGITCCVPLCYNNAAEDRHLKFHCFPRDARLRSMWKHAVRRHLAWEPGPYHKVCSNHFRDRAKTVGSPIPTIFPGGRSEELHSLGRSSSRRRSVTMAQEEREEEIVEETVYQPESLRVVAKKAHLNTLSSIVLQHQKEKAALLKEVSFRDEQMKKLETKLNHKCLSVEGIAALNDSALFRFYTGIPDVETFDILFEELLKPAAENIIYIGSEEKYSERAVTIGVPASERRGRASLLSKRNEFFLVLYRLRHGVDEMDIGERFGISQTTVSRICRSWIALLYERLRQLPIWARRETIDAEMPQSFKDLYPTTRVIIDCTEIFFETPSSVRVQSDTYSSYKHHNTVKALVGISPHCSVTFISELYGGRVSDKMIVKDCGILDLLQPGDSVMADRGFEIEDILKERGVHLNIPPFMNGKAQLSKSDEVKTRRIASVRIHVERAINRVKSFRIISQTVPLTVHKDLSRIWYVCCALTNFLPMLVQ